MSVWAPFNARMEVSGLNRRQRALRATKNNIMRKAPHSLSYKRVLINGVEQEVIILEIKDDRSSKRICALPCEELPHGGIVDFADGKWLITDVNADDEVYASGTMVQCNYLLKWLNDEGNIVERWCVIEDGTKYLIGEYRERIMTVGDARITVTIGKDEDTNALQRGMRFLIDDMDAEEILAYQITKPNKLYKVQNGKGVFRFILNEVNATDDDNFDLRIADYYNWKPNKELGGNYLAHDKTLEEIIDEASSKVEDDEKDVWL